MYRTPSQTRYKTLPTRPHQQPTRYKTLPACPKRPISTRFSQAGRTMYRSHPHDPQQGELCTAPRAKPGTKLSQHAHTSSPPGTKLSPHAPKGPFPRVLAEQGELCTAPSAKPGTKLSQRSRSTAVPRKSSSSTPKNGVFRLFRVCRANYFAHKQATSHAGRIISRTGDRTGSADEGRMR